MATSFASIPLVPPAMTVTEALLVVVKIALPLVVVTTAVNLATARTVASLLPSATVGTTVAVLCLPVTTMMSLAPAMIKATHHLAVIS